MIDRLLTAGVLAASMLAGVVAGLVIVLLVNGLWPQAAILGGVHRSSAVQAPIDLPPATRGAGTNAVLLPPVAGPADPGRPLVVIDAGHGGHDPGASGIDGAHEKDAVLVLAQDLREALLARGGLRVALTRADDRFVALADRAEIARRLHANVFVSLHADASPDHAASGATLYTLSGPGADVFANSVAGRENLADAVGGRVLPNEAAEARVVDILSDLTRRETAVRSQRLSDLVLQGTRGALVFHDQPQRSAAFVVLKSMAVPSLLIEVGYISHPADARAFADRTWRARLASALGTALARFCAEPVGSASLAAALP